MLLDESFHNNCPNLTCYVYEYYTVIQSARDSCTRFHYSTLLPSQLITVQKKLKQRSEAVQTGTRLERVNQLRETEKSKTGGAGLKGTWKKLKGKKKKQRNMTAPEISTQTIAEAARKHKALATVREDDGDKGKGGGKWSKKDNVNASTGEPKPSPSQHRVSLETSMSVTSIRPASQSSNEDTRTSRGNLKLPSVTDHFDTKSEPAITTSHVTVTPPKSADIILTEQFSLSQASGKISNNSLSQHSYTDQFSTQSSSDIPISTFDQTTDEGHFNRGYLSEHHNENHRVGEWPEGGTGDLEEEVYKKGSLKLYWEFGDKQHKLNLQHVKEFLKSSGENEPVDLSVLLDWEGWMIAPKEIP